MQCRTARAGKTKLLAKRLVWPARRLDWAGSERLGFQNGKVQGLEGGVPYRLAAAAQCNNKSNKTPSIGEGDG